MSAELSAVEGQSRLQAGVLAEDGRSDVRAVFVELQADADSGEMCVEHSSKHIRENRKETREREEKNERALVELAQIDPEWAAWERTA